MNGWMGLSALGLVACAGGATIDDATDVTDVCEAKAQETITREVVFERRAPGCDWGVDGNAGQQQGVTTARVEQVRSVEIPDDKVVCDFTFAFNEVDSDVKAIMEYDDNMMLMLNDAVLASSYRPMVDVLESQDELPIYDWSKIVGQRLDFNSQDTWCLGEDEGLSDCVIPPPETSGPIELSFDPSVVARLSARAIQQERYDFTFIATGDNDSDLDCRHEAFRFTVEIPVVKR